MPCGQCTLGYSVLWTVYTSVGRPPDSLHGGGALCTVTPALGTTKRGRGVHGENGGVDKIKLSISS